MLHNDLLTEFKSIIKPLWDRHTEVFERGFFMAEDKKCIYVAENYYQCKDLFERCESVFAIADFVKNTAVAISQKELNHRVAWYNPNVKMDDFKIISDLSGLFLSISQKLFMVSGILCDSKEQALYVGGRAVSYTYPVLVLGNDLDLLDGSISLFISKVRSHEVRLREIQSYFSKILKYLNENYTQMNAYAFDKIDIYALSVDDELDVQLSRLKNLAVSATLHKPKVVDEQHLTEISGLDKIYYSDSSNRLVKTAHFNGLERKEKIKELKRLSECVDKVDYAIVIIRPKTDLTKGDLASGVMLHGSPLAVFSKYVPTLKIPNSVAIFKIGAIGSTGILVYVAGVGEVLLGLDEWLAIVKIRSGDYGFDIEKHFFSSSAPITKDVGTQKQRTAQIKDFLDEVDKKNCTAKKRLDVIEDGFYNFGKGLLYHEDLPLSDLPSDMTAKTVIGSPVNELNEQNKEVDLTSLSMNPFADYSDGEEEKDGEKDNYNATLEMLDNFADHFFKDE